MMREPDAEEEGLQTLLLGCPDFELQTLSAAKLFCAQDPSKGRSETWNACSKITELREAEQIHMLTMEKHPPEPKRVSRSQRVWFCLHTQLPWGV